MGAVYWKETAGTGNFGTAANWDTGVAPVNGDDVYILSGSVNIDAGLTTGITPNSVTVGPNYTGQIGASSASPLTFTGTVPTLTIQTGANAATPTNGTFIKGGTFTNLTIDCANVAQPVSIANTITRCEIRQGTVTIESGTTTDCFLAANISGSTPSNNATLVISTATVTRLYALRGKWSMTGAGTVTDVYHFDSSRSADVQAGTVTNYHIFAGTILHKTTATATKAEVQYGTLDCTDDLRAKTITDVWLGRGGQFLQPINSAVTVTNGVKYLSGSTASASSAPNTAI